MRALLNKEKWNKKNIEKPKALYKICKENREKSKEETSVEKKKDGKFIHGRAYGTNQEDLKSGKV